MAGSAVAHRLARRVLRSPNLTETITLYHQRDGARDINGEWEPGGFAESEILCVTTPTTGEERLLLPEGLREIESRRFILSEDVASISGAAEGDVFVWDSRAYRAERVRDWGGFRDVFAVLPTDADVTDVTITAGSFSADFALISTWCGWWLDGGAYADGAADRDRRDGGHQHRR